MQKRKCSKINLLFWLLRLILSLIQVLINQIIVKASALLSFINILNILFWKFLAFTFNQTSIPSKHAWSCLNNNYCFHLYKEFKSIWQSEQRADHMWIQKKETLKSMATAKSLIQFYQIYYQIKVSNWKVILFNWPYY